MLARLELIHGLVVVDAQLKHIKDMSIENAPKHEVVRSLLLVSSDDEQRAIILLTRFLNKGDIFERHDIVGLVEQQMRRSFTTTQLVNFAH